MKQTGDLNSQLIEFELKEFTNIKHQDPNTVYYFSAC